MSAWGEISRLQSEAEQKERKRRATDKEFTKTMSAWDEGYDLGMRRAVYWDRVDAFGAIRRALEVARYHERVGIEHNSANAINRASAIRAAIRAAIGSDKR